MVEYPIIPIFIFIFGACIGSFLNVVIFRVPEGLSIVSPGSRCPECEKAIPFYWNIPILSYLILGGRCRYCRTGISLRYPAVEALTGVIFLLLFFKYGLTPQTGFWIVFASALIAVSFIDLDHQIIPDIISIPGIVIFTSSTFFIPEMTVLKSITGILAGGGILYAVALAYYLLKKEQGMGGGDIKLLAMIGAATGGTGVLFTLFAGSLLGTLAGGASIALGKRVKSQRIPFGPFLSAGAMIFLLWGEGIILWYFGILA